MFVQSVGYLLFSTSSMFPFIRFLSTLLFYCLLRPNGRIFLLRLRLTRQTLNKQMRRRCDEVRPADWADSLENYYRRRNQILMSRRNAIYLHLFILTGWFPHLHKYILNCRWLSLGIGEVYQNYTEIFKSTTDSLPSFPLFISLLLASPSLQSLI